jgi:hypothetical protein
MKKKVFVIITVLIVIVAAIAIILNFNNSSQAKIINYNKAGIEFSYFDSWKISEKNQDNTRTLSFKKSISSSTITIEVHTLPPSYENYTFQQMVDSVKLKIETSNKDWLNVFSGTTKIGKSNYTAQQMLYETKDKTKQSAIIISQNNNKLFVIIMESNRNEFDLISNDLDTITDSIKVN